MTVDVRRVREWHKDGFVLSTDPALVPLAQLIAAFASADFYWAQPLPEHDMKQMLENSMVFAVYEEQATPSHASSTATHPNLVGFARCVTDFTTFAYLTDVWVKPSHQRRGLGAWIVRCVNEVVEAMPHIRRTLLFTGDWQRSVPFYERLMGMDVLECKPGQGLAVMEKKGRGHPSYGKHGSSYQ